MKVNLNNLFFYSIIWIIFSLSGNYFGSYFKYVNIFLFIVLFFNLLHFILSIKFTYYNQSFSTEHPVKGDRIDYRYYITNSLPFFSSIITVEFNSYLNLENIKLVVKGRETIKKDSFFSLPYRGSYKVGYKNLYISDFLQIFKIKRPLWRRTFYVYPRLDSKYIKYTGQGYIEQKSWDLSKKNKDSFETLNEYTSGAKLSHISWKHFASKGEPFIKSFSSLDSKKLKLFIDRQELSLSRKGPADDKVLEVAVSIMNEIINKKEALSLLNFNIDIDSYKSFNNYYKSTVFEEFNLNKHEIESEFNNSNFSNDDTIFIISPLEGSYFLKKELFVKYPKLILIIITEAMEKKKVESIKKIVESYRLKENRVLWID